MTNYRQPKRFNSFTAVLLLLFAGAGYWMWVFMPAYWDAWTVDHLLREGVATLYQANNLGEPQRSQEMRKILQKIQADAIRLANIKDPDFDVALDLENASVVVRAKYKVVIRHPVGNFLTTLTMNRIEKANIKKVSWD